MLFMSSLHTKIRRELWHIRGQVLAIAAVLMAGIGVCVMSLATYDSLELSREQYYRDYVFADVFVDLTRAPLRLVDQVASLASVARVQARVVAPITLKVQHFEEPVQGLVTSLPEPSLKQPINALHLVRGRLPDPRRTDEVVLSEAFAEQHGLEVQEHIEMILNGRRKRLTIVGLGLSPEHIYQIAPGALFPDFKRYCVMWMAYDALAKGFDMDGAFNNLVLKLAPRGSEPQVIEQLDHLLEPYGGLGAYGRSDQLSHQFLQEEFKQLRTTAYLFPAIFVSVALFLLNVVLSRMIQAQREVIATLKAFGYGSLAIFKHYATIGLCVTALGLGSGIVLGIWLGKGMTQLYVMYYRFAKLEFALSPKVLIVVALGTLLVSLLAIARSVYAAARLAPASAMRPEAPPNFRSGQWLNRAVVRWLKPTSKMIIRQLVRRPVNTVLVLFGLALASAIMMVGNFQKDAVDFMIDVQFQRQQRQDVTLTFQHPVSTKTLSSLQALPGVLLAEGKRVVPVRLRVGARTYRTAIEGLPQQMTLQTVLDDTFSVQDIPPEGLLLSTYLAEFLHVRPGDWVSVETLSGQKKYFKVKVSALSRQLMGAGVYMNIHALNRLVQEAPVINSALLQVSGEAYSDLQRTLRDMPGVAGVNFRQAVLSASYETLDRVILWFTLINTMLGGTIAFGVVYNTIRMALAERGRELASLRVLGYSQQEVAYVLLGEIGLLVMLSLPLGFALGYGLCAFIAENVGSELFRVPLVVSPFTFSMSACVVILAAVISGVLVWSRIKRLDLVAVLKTRE